MGLVDKALVSLAIERVLLDIGKSTYDKVIHDLYKKYRCYLPDCYENPEYLNVVLKELYGTSYHAIVESIRNELEEFAYKKPVDNFLKVLSR